MYPKQMYFTVLLLFLPGGSQRRSFALARLSYGQDGASSEVAAARLFRCSLRVRLEKNRAHLARRPADDGTLAGPRQRIVHVSGFQYPKTAYVRTSIPSWFIKALRVGIGALRSIPTAQSKLTTQQHPTLGQSCLLHSEALMLAEHPLRNSAG